MTLIKKMIKYAYINFLKEMNNQEKKYLNTNSGRKNETNNSLNFEYSKDAKDVEDIFDGVEPLKNKKTEIKTEGENKYEKEKNKLKEIKRVIDNEFGGEAEALTKPEERLVLMENRLIEMKNIIKELLENIKKNVDEFNVLFKGESVTGNILNKWWWEADRYDELNNEIVLLERELMQAEVVKRELELDIKNFKVESSVKDQDFKKNKNEITGNENKENISFNSAKVEMSLSGAKSLEEKRNLLEKEVKLLELNIQDGIYKNPDILVEKIIELESRKKDILSLRKEAVVYKKQEKIDNNFNDIEKRMDEILKEQEYLKISKGRFSDKEYREKEETLQNEFQDLGIMAEKILKDAEVI